MLTDDSNDDDDDDDLDDDGLGATSHLPCVPVTHSVLPTPLQDSHQYCLRSEIASSIWLFKHYSNFFGDTEEYIYEYELRCNIFLKYITM